MSIVVAGASGQLGKLVSEILVDRMTPSDVILATRNPDALAVFARKGAQVRHGDFDQPEALPAALAGAKRMLLISTDALGRRVEQHRNALEAARAAGVEHIVYTSVLNPSPSNPAFVVEEHAETEAMLLDSGLAWTMLRMGNYTEFLVAPGIEAVHEGTYPHNCGNGKIAYVSRTDCASAAAAVLTTDGHEGAVYDITGPELHTQADIARILSDITSIPVQQTHIDDGTVVARAVAAGFPEWLAEGFATWGVAIRMGALEILSSAVPDLTNRSALAVYDVLVEHKDEFLAIPA